MPTKIKILNFRQNQVSLREDAIDREATLMNVLKSVTANRSEPDLIEAGKENERKSSGFSFFGMRSKSKVRCVRPYPNLLHPHHTNYFKSLLPLISISDEGYISSYFSSKQHNQWYGSEVP